MVCQYGFERDQCACQNIGQQYVCLQLGGLCVAVDLEFIQYAVLLGVGASGFQGLGVMINRDGLPGTEAQGGNRQDAGAATEVDNGGLL